MSMRAKNFSGISGKIKEIIRIELHEEVQQISQIKGLGTVNHVFEVKTSDNNYIIRLNDDPASRLEYLKEAWCLQKVAEKQIPVPKVLKSGTHDGSSFMIQEKIPGKNGSLCNAQEKISIWKSLGNYAAKYQNIQRIAVEEVEEAEFHANWQSKIDYNIQQLNEADSLLKKGYISREEQKSIRQILSSLKSREFKLGLIHGDLRPENVIFDGQTSFLIDWGTAEINIVPHMEIGILMMEQVANKQAFDSFLAGMDLDEAAFNILVPDIHKLNLLHRLDKYRWAEDWNMSDIAAFARKVQATYSNI